jgi:hypothetical protein
MLHAQVSEEILDWPQGTSGTVRIRCFVITYTGGDSKARTWVRQSDGTVLQQEASVGSDELILKRELEK